MPEVGEVAHTVANIRRLLIGKTFKNVTAQADNIVFTGLPDAKSWNKNETHFANSDELAQKLCDKTVTSVGRHGKQFWLRLHGDENLVMLLHFGMRGWVKFKDVQTHFIEMENGGYKKALQRLADGVKSESVGKDFVAPEEWPPKFAKLVCDFEGGSFAFVDPRRFARISFYNDSPELDTDTKLLTNVSQLSKLGPDYSKPPKTEKNTAIKSEASDQFLFGDADPNPHGKERPDFDGFAQHFPESSSKNIKAHLLGQELFAGIGNWMSDEILFQAQIDPHLTVGDLSKDTEMLHRLYDSVINVCEKAVQTEADVVQFPDTWLMAYRWARPKENMTTKYGYKLKLEKIGGRTCCWVPEVQKSKRKGAIGTEKPAKRRKTS